MRRFAAVMNHRSAGFKANAMGVWAVPDDELGEIGPRMAGFSLVSHCYRRPTYDDWPYSVFTMVHGKNARECEQTIAAIQAETGVDEYALLWSIKEYKKTRVKYFTPDWDEWSDAHGLQVSAPVPSRAWPDAYRRRNPGRDAGTGRRTGGERHRTRASTRRGRRRHAVEDRLLVRVLGVPAQRAQPVVRDHPRDARGRARRRAGSRRCPSDHVSPQHAFERRGRIRGHDRRAGAARAASSCASQPSDATLNVPGWSSRITSSSAATRSSTWTACTGRRRAPDAQRRDGRAAAATAAAPRRDRAPARCAAW